MRGAPPGARSGMRRGHCFRQANPMSRTAPAGDRGRRARSDRHNPFRQQCGYTNRSARRKTNACALWSSASTLGDSFRDP